MTSPNAQWLATEWNQRFSQIMQTMADVAPQMRFETTADPRMGDVLWWEQRFSCAPDSPIWIGVSEPAWRTLAQLLLSAAGVSNPPVAEIRSTYLEIVRQSMGSLAQEIGTRISKRVSCASGLETAPESIQRQIFEIEVLIPDQPRLLLTLIVSDGLAAAISPLDNSPLNDSADPGSHPELESLSHVAGSRTLELLLDVELPISVSFGRASLRIQDAMKLISGSLIELDRAIGDPVELLVNDCVIARGEVVVIEGNYGVRLTEIVSHRERLQQSRRYMLR